MVSDWLCDSEHREGSPGSEVCAGGRRGGGQDLHVDEVRQELLPRGGHHLLRLQLRESQRQRGTHSALSLGDSRSVVY